jgi:hypothetical protein
MRPYQKQPIDIPIKSDKKDLDFINTLQIPKRPIEHPKILETSNKGFKIGDVVRCQLPNSDKFSTFEISGIEKINDKDILEGINQELKNVSFYEAFCQKLGDQESKEFKSMTSEKSNILSNKGFKVGDIVICELPEKSYTNKIFQVTNIRKEYNGNIILDGVSSTQEKVTYAEAYCNQTNTSQKQTFLDNIIKRKPTQTLPSSIQPPQQPIQLPQQPSQPPQQPTQLPSQPQKPQPILPKADLGKNRFPITFRCDTDI